MKLTKQELGRQLIHIAMGIILVIMYYFNILSPLSVFLGIIVGVMASIISKRIKLPVFDTFLNYFERENERKNFPGRGMIYFFVGVLLVMQLFEKDIAMASIMILALGDSISHIIGERFGQLNNIFNCKSKKLFEGTIAGALAGFIGAVFFVSIPLAFIASFGAMIAEVIQIDLNGNSLDDNIVVPLIAGTIMFLLRMYA